MRFPDLALPPGKRNQGEAEGNENKIPASRWDPWVQTRTFLSNRAAAANEPPVNGTNCRRWFRQRLGVLRPPWAKTVQRLFRYMAPIQFYGHWLESGCHGWRRADSRWEKIPSRVRKPFWLFRPKFWTLYKYLKCQKCLEPVVVRWWTLRKVTWTSGIQHDLLLATRHSSTCLQPVVAKCLLSTWPLGHESIMQILVKVLHMYLLCLK